MTERGEIRPHVNIFVDGANCRFAGGLSMQVQDGAEVMILPAVSGGDPTFETENLELRTEN
jgi:molybdopterin converting factor small subunit